MKNEDNDNLGQSSETPVSAQGSNNTQQKRPQFGTRFLTNPENVFQHNAWDNVSWDEDQLYAAQKKVEANSSEVLQQDLQVKYEDEADQFWNDFYSQHQNRFFKDRHWLFTEFPELATSANTQHLSPNTAEVKGDSISAETGTGHIKNIAMDRTRDHHEMDLCPGNVRNNSSHSGKEPNQVETGQDGALKSESDLMHSGSGDRCVADDTSQDEVEVSVSGAARSEVNARDCGIVDDSGQFPGHWAKTRMLEVGCGVGNTVFPILQTNNDPDLFVYCCDFSDVAINIVKEHADYNSRRCHAFVCDITDEQATLPFPENSLDIVILIFVLSAVHPDKMQSSVNMLSRCLKPGGLILLRDYGRYDMAQLRFKKGRCLSEHFYVRGDGTRVYFFTQDELRDLFIKAGLKEEQNMVDRRLQVNRGRQLTMYRVWIQCKYRKPTLVS